MDHYRDALEHLNGALDAMMRQGDTRIIADIAQPIASVESAILRMQIDVIHRAAQGGPAAG